MVAVDDVVYSRCDLLVVKRESGDGFDDAFRRRLVVGVAVEDIRGAALLFVVLFDDDLGG